MLDDTTIRDVAETIWTTVLGLGIEPAELPPAGSDSHYFTGCVHLTGAWEGAVSVHFSEDLARRVSSLIFEIDPTSATEEDIQDSVGELSNMTGGNLKSLLPPPCHLTLPTVTHGTDYSQTVPGGRLVNQIAFDCDGEPLVVSLFEREDAA